VLLSAVVVCRNEAELLPQCLSRLGFADELLLLRHGELGRLCPGRRVLGPGS
jgi:hypothetical protein